ncbi:hypothetical protein H8959_007021, partial [Pygathrix nigripes]
MEPWTLLRKKELRDPWLKRHYSGPQMCIQHRLLCIYCVFLTGFGGITWC